jgi:hypothetical protein
MSVESSNGFGVDVYRVSGVKRDGGDVKHVGAEAAPTRRPKMKNGASALSDWALQSPSRLLDVLLTSHNPKC